MNNDELKKKIVEALKNTVIGYDCGHAIIAKNFYAERVFEVFADALIAAGIGDDKEAERKSFVFKNELAFTIHRARAAELVAEAAAEAGFLKYEEMKHRAEVAERALEVACEKSNYCPNPSETIYNNDSECFETIDHCEYETEDCASCRNRYFLQQAEKELSKEGKDE